MSKKPKTFYEFGPFRLDAAEQQLWRDGEEIALTPKAFGVLRTLIEHTGQTLLKDELLKAVWPDAIVEEHNLADNISILRQLWSGHNFGRERHGCGRLGARRATLDCRWRERWRETID